MSTPYQPLPSDAFRLLTLHPLTTQPSQISATLSAHPFPPSSLCPLYEALSYVWGPPALTYHILLNEQNVPITKNLHDVLHRLRSAEPRVLWIDQLCINQSDIAERSSQVQLMGTIYTHASRVIMWLGPDPSHTAARALHMVHLLGEPGRKLWPEDVLPTTANLAAAGLPERDGEDWAAFNTLLALPYFSRMWILQECILAPSRLILWDTTAFDWEELARALEWCKESVGLHNMPDSPVGREALLRAYPLILKERGLHGLLRLGAGREATERRDRVFALLGLLREEERGCVGVDYGKAVEVVFAEAARAVVRKEGGLEVLANAFAYDGDEDAGEWPSWVPDWEASGVTPVSILAEARGFDAAGERGLKLATDDGVVGEELVLKIEGVRCGVVKHMSSVAFDPDNQPVYEDHVLDQFGDAWTLVLQHARTPYEGEPLIKALLWTMLCGARVLFDSVNRQGKGAAPEDMKWRDSIYADFAMNQAMMLWLRYAQILNPNPPPVPEMCQRHRLALAETAALIHEKLLEGDAAYDEQFHADGARKWRDDWITSLDGKMAGQYEQLKTMIGRDTAIWHGDGEIAKQAVDVLSPFLGISKFEKQFKSQYVDAGYARRFFVTDDGLMGVGSTVIEEDDLIVVLFGGKVPYMLRPAEKGYRFLGECYVHGLMKGEGVERRGGGDAGEIFSIY